MCTGKYTYSKAIDILLNGSIDNLFGSLPYTGIDNLHTGISKGSCHNYRSPVVTIQPGFCNQYPYSLHANLL